jgi:pilus assembly protein CpaC
MRVTVPATRLALDIGEAKIIPIGKHAVTIFIADPAIADLQVPHGPDDRKFVIYGRKAGVTTVFTITHSGHVSSYLVTVKHPVEELATALSNAVPSAHVNATSTPNGITVTGTVDSPRDAERLKTTAKEFLGEKAALDFNVGVVSATQVNLRVRVAEVSRSADKEFNFNWGALYNSGSMAIGLLTGRAQQVTSGSGFSGFSPSPANLDSFGVAHQNGGTNVTGLIDALVTEGLVTVLAEPNLTAISGESASFLAGGEFPVPVPQGLAQVTIEWRKYGVSLEFTPFVLDAHRLSIKVHPEVSELTTVGSVVIGGTTVPGLTVRRAETTIELASGQSFAIAGLFLNNGSAQIARFPWLGDVPVLGALFRSTSYQHNESELVIIVTPYIVQPIAQSSDVHLPTEGVVYASDLERILLGRMTSRHPQAGRGAPAASPTPHLKGDAGFMLER